MRARRSRLALVLVAALAVTQLPGLPSSLAGGAPSTAEVIAEAQAAGRVDASVVQQLQGGGSATALVYVDDVPASPAPLTAVAAPTPSAISQSDAASIDATGRAPAPSAAADVQAQGERRGELDARKAAAQAGAGTRVKLTRSYADLPVSKVTVTSLAGLAALLSSPATVLVGDDVQLERNITTSLNLIGQPAALTGTTGGQGTYVGVLDSGADYTNPALGSCSAPNTPSNTCRVAELPPDFATPDGTLDDTGKHGTEVSAIIAATAPGTKLIVGDVFNGSSASTSDILSGIQYMITRRQAGLNVVALNVSLGISGTYSCTVDRFGLATLEGQGIQPVVASGNSAYTSGIGYRDGLSDPACASPVVRSVGGVYNQAIAGTVTWGSGCSETPVADKVMCISQSASTLSLLAPGALISVAGSTNIGGTSFAAPFVAGAVAFAKAARPDLGLSAIRSALTSTGTLVTDARFSRTTPRLNLSAVRCRLSSEDSRSLPVTVPATDTTVCAVNSSATSEAGDPATPGSGRTLWYQIPAGSGRITISSTPGVVLRALRGGSLVGANGDGSTITSVGPFEASLGPMEVMVDTMPGAPSSSTLTITRSGSAAPGNDAQTAALTVGTGVTLGENAFATAESGEVHGGSPADRSVWYRWTPNAQTAGVSLDGSNFTPRLQVKRESDGSNVCDVVSAGGTVQCVIGRADGSFLIAVDSANGQYGTIRLTTLVLDAVRTNSPAVTPAPTAPRGVAPSTPAVVPGGRTSAPEAAISR